MAKKKGSKKKISPITTETNRLLFIVAVVLMLVFCIGSWLVGLF